MIDPMKAKRFKSLCGKEFYVNRGEHKIQTTDGEVSIEYRRHGLMNKYTSFFLNFGKKSIKISGPEDDNLETKTSFQEGAEPPTHVTLNGLHTGPDKFVSFEQQEYLINLMTEMWSRFSGDWIGAALGEDQSSTIIMSDEFKSKLRSGVYVNG